MKLGGEIANVDRPKSDAIRFYDGISGLYDYLSGPFERRFTKKTIGLIDPKEGEAVLEVGFGTGHGLESLAKAVGEREVSGLDISTGMIRKTLTNLGRDEERGRVGLCRGDGANLPYRDGVFDAVLMAFTLELFDTPEIARVLMEIRRVLKGGGRLGVSSLSKAEGEGIPLRIYEWAHNKWPRHIDCRPIYVSNSLSEAGFRVETVERFKMVGLPVAVAIGSNPERPTDSS